MKKINLYNTIYYLFDLYIVLFVTGLLFNNSDLTLYSTIIFVFANIFFSMFNLKENIVFFGFNTSIFIFLLSRFFVTSMMGLSFEYGGIYEMGIKTEIVIIIINLIALSVLSYSFGYYLIKYSKNIGELNHKSITLYIFSSFIKKIDLKKVKKFKIKLIDDDLKKYIFRVAIIVFIISVILRVYVLFGEYKLIKEIGYRANYLNSNVNITIFTRLLDYISRMELAAFIILLSTCKNKKYIIILSVLFMVPGVLILISGERSVIMLRGFLLLTYFIINIKDNKNLIKIIIGLILSLPIILLILYYIETMRGTETTIINNSGNKILNSIGRLLYNQGVSARTIGNVEVYKEYLPNKIYSFGEIIDFFNFAVLGRIQGISEPVGQTGETFLRRAELAHSLSFLQSTNEYLNLGLGLGSSYIAELYHDFSTVGVFIGSFIYGILFYKLPSWIKSKSVIISLLALYITKNIIFTPRSSFSFIFRDILNETLILTTLIIFILGYLYMIIEKKRNKNISKS